MRAASSNRKQNGDQGLVGGKIQKFRYQLLFGNGQLTHTYCNAEKIFSQLCSHQ